MYSIIDYIYVVLMTVGIVIVLTPVLIPVLLLLVVGP